MNEPFEYRPLECVFRALEELPDARDGASLIENLKERGLDPEKTTATVSAKVNAFLKKNRLSWQEIAKQKQENLRAAAALVVSWASRKQEEIERAFASVQQGTYGPAAQMKLQAAHRNLTNISLQDKATLLDEIDILCRLQQGEVPPEKEP